MASSRFLYLHGFASSAQSTKGVALRELFAASDVELELPDLNVPSFERQTYSDVLRHLDGLMDDDRPVRLLGSSMGGYLAARWCELHPGRVERMVLLCPGFDLAARWPLLIGSEAMERWRETGSHPVEDGAGTLRALHWGFVDDAHSHPAYPDTDCPTMIVHGTRDEVVPVDQSRRYVEGRPGVRLLEVDDDHRLLESLDGFRETIRDFLLEP